MKDSIFLSGGVGNWKDATIDFVKHKKTMTHKIPFDLIVTLPRTTSVEIATNIEDALLEIVYREL